MKEALLELFCAGRGNQSRNQRPERSANCRYIEKPAAERPAKAARNVVKCVYYELARQRL